MTVWTAFGRPCELPYLPTHPLCGAVSEIDAMADPQTEAARHHENIPGAVAHRTDGWQLCQDFENALELVYSAKIDAMKTLKRELFEQFSRKESERRQVADLHEADETAAREMLRRLAEFRKAHLETATLRSLTLTRADGRAHFDAVFTAPGEPAQETLRLWLGRAAVEKYDVPALVGSVSRDGDVLTAAFEMEALPTVTGEYEFFLYGQTRDGQPFQCMRCLNL